MWRDVPGLDFYQVSKTGEVRRLAHTDSIGRHLAAKTLAGTVNPQGYVIHLIKGRQRRAHHLVLEAFVGPRPEGLECLHDNDDPADNRLENLRWGTRRENTLDKVRNGGHPFASRATCKNGHPYTEETTWLYRGARLCRECRRQSTIRWRKRQH